MPDTPPHVARILAADPNDCWLPIEPDSSRRLVISAVDAFGTLGFEGATTRAIASRAGLSPAAVYVHYETKLDLLETILVVAHQQAWLAVVEALEGVEGPTERLRVFAEAFAAWHAMNFRLGRVAQYELPSLPEERVHKVAQIRRRFGRLIRHELRNGVEQDGFEVPDLGSASLVILSLGIDVVRWYSPEGRIGIPELARVQGDFAVRMVKPWHPKQAGGDISPARLAPAIS